MDNRTLILDEEGNSVITCNEDFTIITILSGEIHHRNGVRPAQKFSIGGIDAIKAIRDYLNSICAKNAQAQELKKEKEEVLAEYIYDKSGDAEKRLKEINLKLTNLKGNSVNGKRRVI